jgi:thiamine-phosphate pyrophosphorylase
MPRQGCKNGFTKHPFLQPGEKNNCRFSGFVAAEHGANEGLERMTPRLALITPLIDSAVLLPVLETVLGAAPFASVLLSLGPADERIRMTLARQYVPLVQKYGAAALVEADDPRFAARSGADGVHLRYSEDKLSDIGGIRPERILGFGGLRTRDDAMNAGEQADYVMFGEPSSDGYVQMLQTIVDRCQWWAEIFETPCIGYAPNLEAVAALAKTGADFIALGPWCFDGDQALIITQAAAALTSA